MSEPNRYRVASREKTAKGSFFKLLSHKLLKGLRTRTNYLDRCTLQEKNMCFKKCFYIKIPYYLISYFIIYACRDDMQRLPYLNRCIKECLRLHTPVPFAVRSAAEDFELEGYTIPKGTDISANIYMLHHNETVWGDDHMVCRICHGFLYTIVNITLQLLYL